MKYISYEVQHIQLPERFELQDIQQKIIILNFKKSKLKFKNIQFT